MSEKIIKDFDLRPSEIPEVIECLKNYFWALDFPREYGDIKVNFDKALRNFSSKNSFLRTMEYYYESIILPRETYGGIYLPNRSLLERVIEEYWNDIKNPLSDRDTELFKEIQEDISIIFSKYDEIHGKMMDNMLKNNALFQRMNKKYDGDISAVNKKIQEIGLKVLDPDPNKRVNLADILKEEELI